MRFLLVPAILLALAPGSAGPLPASAGPAVLTGTPAPIGYRTLAGADREFYPMPYARTVDRTAGTSGADRRVTARGSGGGSLGFLGYYSVAEGGIRLHPDLPEASEERTVLPHEYGHAFTQDFLCGESRDAGQLEAYRDALARAVRGCGEDAGNGLPPALGPVLRDYLAAEADLYDRGGYFTSSFDEYLAESYRRMLRGDGRAPAATREFFLGFTVASHAAGAEH